MIRFLLGFVLLTFLTACAEKGSKEAFDPERNYSGEELARMYCGSCHLYPEPALLSANIWDRKVLPLMGQKLGIIDFKLAVRDGGVKLENQIKISDSNWQKLKAFYLANAADGKEADVHQYPFTSTFQVQVPESSIVPLTTVVQYNPRDKALYVASSRTLYELDVNFAPIDSLLFPFPITHILQREHELEVLCVGNIHPNDRQEGKLFVVNWKEKVITEVLDSLRRPVFFASLDLDKDGVEEKVVCEFGNNEGELSLSIQQGGMEKRILSSTPGARKVIGHDFDGNGYTDLMVQFCQGNERISIFYNDNMKFREEVVARFPPVYGSSTFDTLDINKDGKLDFYVVFGDNADYSIMLKEYHGVRIFENDGSDRFQETHFMPVYGATDARANDFDHDGDLDIAVIAHFADYQHAPQNSFVYLENEQGSFKPSIVNSLPAGKWLTMEKADIDQDGDQDLFLGSFMLKIPRTGAAKLGDLPPFIQLENQGGN